MIELDFDFTEILDEEITSEDMPVKDKARAKKRKVDYKKAVRKKKIDDSKTNFPLYNNLHQYSKNKIHCSCPLCCFEGPTAADMRKKDSMEYQLKETLDDTQTIEEATPDYYDGCESFRWFEGAEAI